ncbi:MULTISPECIES: peptidoglycan D,D-transpeptidase FtsI family protein [Burkholderia cepacia complex]|uniref:peptidoglycan D,D-transpeptidase FtsI family protein n=1 Tax=Burkholderia cepacia complex TaxID=87882 RepID=UPI000660C076|nr:MULTISPECIES: penicillin-binding protein 2 [Burkholderia cepacia complex]MCA8462095.1 penicillin-binding protein 2 [Burkholderia multivorans]MDN7865961.1 penicillin-binding protein 2 [Burkholderia multivorans]MDN8017816.1 penicillin-binding protein 2 [Burkholderia multivorans]MDN8050670.1 penicillin-binding protein 2 [Burkholderia multivorans]MDN8053995.1 penicillin-binding protein 2 [Burkholderia multivorans]
MNHSLDSRFRARSAVLGLAFGVAFFALIARAFWVQCINDGFYQVQGNIRQIRDFTVHAARGRILDRNGKILAMSLPTRALWVDARDVPPLSDRKLAAVAALLGIKRSRIEQAYRHHRSFAYLQRQVPLAIAQAAIRLDIPGLHAESDYRRFYPEGAIAAHVTGFANVDGKGQEGVERAENAILTGTDGLRRVLRNARGEVIDSLAFTPPRPGRDIRLSIDRSIQYAAFKAIQNAVQRTGAQAGSAIVIDAHTGEILAMANWPGYDPNSRSAREGMHVRNRAATDVFEPGSVLKPLTIALALQRGVVTPSTIVPTDGGRLRLDHAVIHDDKNFGTLTVSQVIQKSSNVGTTKIALMMSPQVMWKNFRAVGLGKPPHTGLPGTTSGSLRPYRTWRRIEQATMSYGYGLSASLLQLAQAYSVFANDGVFVPATIYIRSRSAVRGHRVYSTKVARQVRQMLRAVISADGTAPLAAIPGYTAAGKTGTAYRWTSRGYNRDEYRASFVGMIPAQAPRVIIAVSIDRPRKGSHFGGAVSGPVFSRIGYDVMRILNVVPDDPSTQFACDQCGTS